MKHHKMGEIILNLKEKKEEALYFSIFNGTVFPVLPLNPINCEVLPAFLAFEISSSNSIASNQYLEPLAVLIRHQYLTIFLGNVKWLLILNAV